MSNDDENPGLRQSTAASNSLTNFIMTVFVEYIALNEDDKINADEAWTVLADQWDENVSAGFEHQPKYEVHRRCL